MLGDCELMAFVATTQPEKAKAFYSGTLGLKLIGDTPFALVFSSGGITLRVQKVQAFSPHQFTALGWKVADIAAAAAQLANKGITLERYQGMNQDAAGIWTAPGGGKVCWFKDPDGNTLSLTQAP
jgi:catechol 2,3-dioxygenase-like lactoylglutathione lyase family enzyme